VRVVYWKVEQDIETLERRETLYHVSAIDRRWSEMAVFRYSDGIFVRIGSLHFSDIIYRGGWQRISPGNDLKNDSQTVRHLPIDFTDDHYLFGTAIRAHDPIDSATGRHRLALNLNYLE
jgi:hypothetical protein